MGEKKNALYTYPQRVLPMTAHLCQLMDTIKIKMDHWIQNKTLYSNDTATSEHTSAISLRQRSHILWLGGSLWLHFSSPDFCQSWGNILINMSFTKGWVCRRSHALYHWIRSWIACLTIFAKRCFPVLPVFLSNKEDALPNVLPLRSQRQKPSTLPQEKKKKKAARISVYSKFAYFPGFMCFVFHRLIA